MSTPTSPSTPSSPSSHSTSKLTSYCDLPLSPLHSLSCGHVIYSPLSLDLDPHTPSSPVLPNSYPKSPCSPNCTPSIFSLKPQIPLSWLKHTVPEPFICPQCVEECTRADYDSLLARSGQKPVTGLNGLISKGSVGSTEGSAKEVNTRIWTYAAMMDMIRDGGRECSGTAGLFATQDALVQGSIVQAHTSQPSVEGAWCVRETSSQEKMGDAAYDAGGDGEPMAPGGEDVGRDTKHGDVDELAEMMQDARVGLEVGDVSMDELMAGVEGLST